MSKYVILLLDEYQAFTRGFKRFLEVNKLADVHIISSIEEIEGYTYDFLLVNETDYDQLEYPDCRVFRLTMETGCLKKETQVISRMLKANEIMNLLKISQEVTQARLPKVLLFSMSGGTGKSTLGTGICDAVEVCGKRTFSLSFAPNALNGEGDIDLSLLIYYFYTQGTIPSHVEHLVDQELKSSKSKLTCLLSTPEDVTYLTPKVLTLLMNWLYSMVLEHLIVIEAPWSFGPELQILLQSSTHRVLVADERHSNDDVMLWKEKYNTLINSNKEFYVVMNRVVGQKSNQSVFCIPRYEKSNCRKGIREWTNKYLLTHWIKR
jgi:hypothetical protein